MKIEDWLGADNKIGIDIWNKKYRHGSESFEEWLNRVSGSSLSIKQLIIDKKFLYAGRILANRGLHKEGLNVTYSNCYVVSSPEDSIESIFDTAGKIARTFSYGGGVGIDLSKLAPRGATINNTAKVTSGAVSFTDLYSMVTELIGQHGRRGALMLTMSCEHPDLEEFMSVKTDLERVTKANMSIRVTDEFMKAVRDKRTFVQTFTRPETGEVITKELDAHSFFMDMCRANWNYGEPACLFWDTVTESNMMSNHSEYKLECTNPCGEQPLPAGGSCLLGSINLAEFVSDSQFDFEDFEKAVRTAIIGLNEVLDEGMSLHPLEEQRNAVRDWRQIGLGIMGLSDMLVKLGLEYGSEESLQICENIAQKMIHTAIETSTTLARLHGAFPMCNPTSILESEFIKTIDYPCGWGIEQIKDYGLRNSHLLTIAPTGSISTMLGISGGIEPIFANSYERRTVSLSDQEETYQVYTPVIKDLMDTNDLTEDDLPDYCVTARDIDYKKRIDMQAVWQTYIDASISSTVNLPATATPEDIYNLYMYAWEKGCKGVTVFREGCQRDSILTTTTAEPDPTALVGKKRKLITGCGNLHCTAFFDPANGSLAEVYLNKGSTGGCNNFMIGLSRMMSLSARNGVDIFQIVDQLKSSGSCPSYAVRRATQKDASKGSSCPVAVGHALVDMWKDMQTDLGNVAEERKVKSVNPCPVCDSELESQGGCMVCIACGWTRCD